MRFLGYSAFSRAVAQARLLDARSFQQGSLNGQRMGKMWRSAPRGVRAHFRRISAAARPLLAELRKGGKLGIAAQKRTMKSRAVYNLTMKWVYACPTLRENLSGNTLTAIAASTSKNLSKKDKQRVKEAEGIRFPKVKVELPELPPNTFFVGLITTRAVEQYSPAFQAYVTYKSVAQLGHASLNEKAAAIDRCKELWDAAPLKHIEEAFANIDRFEDYCVSTIPQYPLLHRMLLDTSRWSKLGQMLIIGFLNPAKEASLFGEKLEQENLRKELQRTSMGIPQDKTGRMPQVIALVRRYKDGDFASKLYGKTFRKTINVKGTNIEPYRYQVSNSTVTNQGLLETVVKAKASLPRGGASLSAYELGVAVGARLRPSANQKLILETYPELEEQTH